MSREQYVKDAEMRSSFIKKSISLDSLDVTQNLTQIGLKI